MNERPVVQLGQLALRLPCGAAAVLRVLVLHAVALLFITFCSQFLLKSLLCKILGNGVMRKISQSCFTVSYVN